MEIAQQVTMLAKAGKTPREIATTLGINPKQLYDLYYKDLQEGYKVLCHRQWITYTKQKQKREAKKPILTPKEKEASLQATKERQREYRRRRLVLLRKAAAKGDPKAIAYFEKMREAYRRHRKLHRETINKERRERYRYRKERQNGL